MRWFRDLPIRQKLTTITVSAAGIPLLLACAAFVTYDQLSLRSQMVGALATRCQIIGRLCISALEFKDPESSTGTLASLANDGHVIWAGLYDGSGALFASYGRGPGVAAAARLPAFAASGEGYRLETGRVAMFQPLTSDRARIGTLVIESDLDELRARLKRYTVVVAGVLFASVLLAYAIASRLQRLLSGPVLHLVSVANAVTVRKDYSVRAVPEGRDELGLLTLTFNEMLEQIQGRDAAIHELNLELEQRVQERTQALEATNNELEAFSYSVSHDLRAPLRGIDGFSQVLLEDHGGQLDAEGRAHLERIRAGAQHMGGLIDDLLKLSRMSRAELRQQEVDVSALVSEVADGLLRRQPDRLVCFTIEPGLVTRADPRLLRIALDNLLGNAWKFTRDRPEALIAFGALSGDSPPVYFVRDNGAGFDMAYADKLFTPFQRLHSPREFEGTGIGLAIVARVIHRHGGKVWAAAAVGQGATIHFTLGPSGAEGDWEEAKA